jgi:hypothetical protein
MMQMGVRMYSPQIGRFLSVDPLFELMPGQNPYHYAFNSPLMWRDPSGMKPEKEKNGKRLLGEMVPISQIGIIECTATRIEINYTWIGPIYTSTEYDCNGNYGESFFSHTPYLGRLFGGSGCRGGGAMDFNTKASNWGGVILPHYENGKFISGGNENKSVSSSWGKGAWRVSNSWNDNNISEYSKFAGTQANIYKDAGKRFTCEDLALQVLIDFASQNGLPVIIQNDEGTFNASDSKWNNNVLPIRSFRDQLLSSTNSNHLLNFSNTVGIEINDLLSGDLLVQVNNKGRGHHTQLITGINNFWIEIIQGNTEGSLFRQTGNPSSIFGYVGTVLNTSYYNRSDGSFYSGNTHMFFEANIFNQFVRRRWNFNKFNSGK